MDNTTEICRLCMLNGGKSMETIFNQTNTSCIADMIARVTQLTIFEGDGLPVNVCQKCLFQLETANTFIQRCTSSDKFLRSLHLAGVEVHPVIDNLQSAGSSGNSAGNRAVEILPLGYNADPNKCVIKEEAMDDIEFEEMGNARPAYVIGDDYEDDNITIKMENLSNPNLPSTAEVQESGTESSTDLEEDKDDMDYTPERRHLRVKSEPSTLVYDITTRSVQLIPENNEKTEYKCHLCPQRFCDKKDLKKHLTHISEMHPYQCEQLEIPTTSKLTRKKKAGSSPIVHQFKCRVAKCHSMFKNEKTLVYHEANHFTAGKHKCGQCDRTFKQRVLLLNHTLIHR